MNFYKETTSKVESIERTLSQIKKQVNQIIMKTIDNIIEITTQFLNGHDKANERYNLWKNEKFQFVVDVVEKIATKIIASNDFFKSNLYVNYDSELKNYITLRSGNNYIPLSNEASESFEITFLQISNGKIYVYAKPYKSDQNFNNIELDIVSDVGVINENWIIETIYNGLDEVKKYSYLFIGDYEL